MFYAPFVLYVALTHAPNRTVRDRSTIVQPLGALHIVSMLDGRNFICCREDRHLFSLRG
jgi:hypothetical protein